MWWMAAGVALNALSGMSAAKGQRAQQNLNNAVAKYDNERNFNNNLLALNDQLAASTAHNEAIIEANQKNTVASNFKAGLISMQMGIAKKTQAQERTDLSKLRGQALGGVNANAAAAGTIGSSVEAVAQDVDRTVGEALVKTEETWDIQENNFSTQMHDLYSNLQNMLQTASVDRSRDPVRGMVFEQNNVPSNKNIWQGAIANGVMQYAGAQMNLGLGGGSPGQIIPGLGGGSGQRAGGNAPITDMSSSYSGK